MPAGDATTPGAFKAGAIFAYVRPSPHGEKRRRLPDAVRSKKWAGPNIDPAQKPDWVWSKKWAGPKITPPKKRPMGGPKNGSGSARKTGHKGNPTKDIKEENPFFIFRMPVAWLPIRLMMHRNQCPHRLTPQLRNHSSLPEKHPSFRKHPNAGQSRRGWRIGSGADVLTGMHVSQAKIFPRKTKTGA
ncbi:MAG: hypothetical protein JWM59_4190 [Verrucomicrobiales bacterium]|nr:hypothetical protein [Verrucomicrobiales bacterium]